MLAIGLLNPPAVASESVHLDRTTAPQPVDQRRPTISDRPSDGFQLEWEINDDQFIIRPGDDPSRWRLSLGAAVWAGEAASEPIVNAGDHTIELQRDGWMERYRRVDLALDQTLILDRLPPQGELHFDVDGGLFPSRNERLNAIDFHSKTTPLRALRYTIVGAYDGSGAPLSVKADLEADRITLRLPPTPISLPVTIEGRLSSFSWQSEVAVGSHAAAWGDIDGDGDLDLAVGHEATPSGIYFNDGGRLQRFFPLGELDGVRDLAWGDWDDDGDLDLAVAVLNGANLLYRNDQAALSLHWASDELEPTRAIRWTDWDSDGDLDLAVGNDGEVDRIYENRFGALSPQWQTEDRGPTRDFVLSDWDGDGRADLVTARYNAPNIIYLNLGEATLRNYAQTLQSNPTTSVATFFWDQDPRIDVVFGNDGSANKIYRNFGFSLAESWSSAEIDQTQAIAVADIDLDGEADLFFGNSAGPDRLHLGSTRFGLDWSTLGAADTRALALGDWDGDGSLDIVTATADRGTRIFDSNAGIVQPQWESPVFKLTMQASWGDWDGDGDLDLAIANDDQRFAGFVGSIDIMENTGTTMIHSWRSPERKRFWAVEWGDWDGDGDLDLAAGLAAGPLHIYRNVGRDFELVWTSDVDRLVRDLAWGDWDNDGDLDLAVAQNKENVVYRNTGDGMELAWSSEELEHSASVAWADYDDDGDLDLAVGNSFNQPNRIYDNVDGDLVPNWESAELENTESMIWGDVDGDGDLDLVAGNFAQPNRVYRNDGDRWSVDWVSSRLDDTTDLALGDWDSDGDLDLVTGNLWEKLRIHENVDGEFIYRRDGGKVDALLESLAMADFDGDGDLDVVASNRCPIFENRVYGNRHVDERSSFGAQPLHPVAVERPGRTDTAFFLSSADRLTELPIEVPYQLVDQEGAIAPRVTFEYSAIGGGDWRPATAYDGENPALEMSASADGERHLFRWDAASDGVCSDQAVLRIGVPTQTPAGSSDNVRLGALATVTPPFRVGGPRVDWYLDADGDGFGDPLSVKRDCWQPVGYVDEGSDCDDTERESFPGGQELPGTARDEDCDGVRICDPLADWKNHGSFVRCVNERARELESQGRISAAKRSELIRAAAQSDVGKR